jgi:pyruvate formate lyase activating enzyme
LKAGLHYVYTGNVHDAKGQSTYCSSCQRLLIERDWHELGEWNVDALGRCHACGVPLAGHFDPTPGRWGRRRQRVFIRPGI